MIANSTLITHWFQYYFVPANEVWWRGAVWGNVFAVLPLAILGALGYFYHRAEVKALHATHDEHLRSILEALDPEAESDTQLDRIADKVDETTPGGITAVLEAIKPIPPPKSVPPRKRSGKAPSE